MHLDNNTLILFTMGALVLAMAYNQMKFRGKMLCTFLRPNKLKIEKFVPLDSKYVVFDNGRSGKGRYFIDPRCIKLMWYNRDLITRIFPQLIPTMDFRWDTQYPDDPERFNSTFKSPEAVDAAYQEHEQIAFSKGAAVQAGTKKKLPDWIWAAGALAIAIAVFWYFNKATTAQIQSLANAIATKAK